LPRWWPLEAFSAPRQYGYRQTLVNALLWRLWGIFDSGSADDQNRRSTLLSFRFSNHHFFALIFPSNRLAPSLPPPYRGTGSVGSGHSFCSPRSPNDQKKERGERGERRFLTSFLWFFSPHGRTKNNVISTYGVTTFPSPGTAFSAAFCDFKSSPVSMRPTMVAFCLP